MSDFVVYSGVAVNLVLAFITGWWFKERILNALPLKEEQFRQLWSRMQDFSADVASNLDDHSTRVNQLSQELDTLQSTRETPDRANAERDIVAQILAANKQLHEQLAASERRIQQQMQTIQSMSTETRIDPLTNLANRQAFDEEFSRRYAAWQHRPNPLSLVLAGVDNLQEIQAEHGTEAGNEALREVGRVLAEGVRDMDVVVRYGDTEFIIVLPETNVAGGKVLAERSRAAVQAAKMDFQGQELGVTISVGVAEIQAGDDMASFLGHASLALLAAQDNGRNRAYFYHEHGCRPIIPGADDEPVPGNQGVAGPTTLTNNELRIHSRRMFLRTELIAPYVGERFPAQDDFIEIQCFDISAGGISFFLPRPPEHQAYVLALGQAPNKIYTTARVVRVSMTRLHTLPMYIIGCQFTGRIQATGNPRPASVASAG